MIACTILILLGVYTLVSKTYEALNRPISDRESTFQDLLELEEKMKDLQKKIEEIERSYTMLASNYSTLTSNYISLHQNYGKLQDLIIQISKRALMKPEDLPEIIEISTRRSSSLELLLYKIKISKNDQPELKAEKIISWILNNLEYIPDDFHEIIVYNNVVQVQDYVSFPDEVIERGGGDCEDLAILTYAILDRVLGESESVYLIGLEGVSPYSYRYRIGWAHMAVLYKVGNEFIIIDPTGAYVTDRKYTMRIIIDKVSEEREHKIFYYNPLMLSPKFKNQFINDGIAELTFAVDSSVRSDEVNRAISEWLRKWEVSIPQIYVSFIANSTFYMKFNSTEEFLDFTNLRGL